MCVKDNVPDAVAMNQRSYSQTMLSSDSPENSVERTHTQCRVSKKRKNEESIPRAKKRPRQRCRAKRQGELELQGCLKDWPKSPEDTFLEIFEKQASIAGRAQAEKVLTRTVARILEKACLVNRIGSPIITSLDLNDLPTSTHPSQQPKDTSSNIFFSLAKPKITILQYVRRLAKYLQVSHSVFIVSLIYLDRMQYHDRALTLCDLNVHRLWITAVCLASKYLEDEVHRNSHLAKVGGIPTIDEMNRLELEFLKRIQWNCSVKIDTYLGLVRKIQQSMRTDSDSGRRSNEAQVFLRRSKLGERQTSKTAVIP